MDSESHLKAIKQNMKKANETRLGRRDWSYYTPMERADNLEKLFRRLLEGRDSTVSTKQEERQ